MSSNFGQFFVGEEDQQRAELSMKVLSALLSTLCLITSCHIKQKQPAIQKTLLNRCDELDIIYYSADTFMCKISDTTVIKDFIKLITYDNDDHKDTCETSGQLVFECKGEQLFSAQLASSSFSNYVAYTLGSKAYRHLLTYRTGMGIDQLYWHKVDPQDNSRQDIDTAKIQYKEMKEKKPCGQFVYFTKSRSCEMVQTRFDFETGDSCHYSRGCSSNTTDEFSVSYTSVPGKWVNSNDTITVELSDTSGFQFRVLTDTTLEMLIPKQRFGKLVLYRKKGCP